MKNLIIIGCGRSGTSALAGMLHNSGYNVGNNYIPLRESNPKGFFEDRTVTRINDRILFNSYPKKAPFLGCWIMEYKDSNEIGWIVRMALNARLFSNDKIKEDIKEIIKNEPFCYKDPRFCYTVPVWKPFLKNTNFICIFREPSITAASMIKQRREYLLMKEISLDFSTAVEIWTLMYQHVLEKHSPFDNWLFIHYNQLFTEKGLDRVDKFLGIKVDRTFIDEKLKRTKSSRFIPEETVEVYKKLCYLAGY
ncbi:MAG: sulfotransferase [Candidatus Nanoarchaeia archaeon]|nr:sulfotransferase [Candidatus Nanoarchaeia archaeon]